MFVLYCPASTLKNLYGGGVLGSVKITTLVLGVICLLVIALVQANMLAAKWAECSRIDLNQDQAITIADFSIFREHYGSRKGIEDYYNPQADFNNDGVVDNQDLDSLKQNFGSQCNPLASFIGAFNAEPTRNFLVE